MSERAGRTFICSVLFLDIVAYSRKPVSEQIRLKDHFNALIASALRDVAPADRIILDTGDGVAINFLGDPEDALFVAISLRDAFGPEPARPPDVPVRIGINLGPVRLVRDLNGRPNIIGDGINVAQRVMGFASANQILVSRSYYEVVSRISEGYAKLFTYEGSHTDKHVREHEIYSVGYSTTAERHKPPADHAGAATETTGGHRPPGVELIERVWSRAEPWLGNRSIAYGGTAFSTMAFVLAVTTSFLGETPQAQEQPRSGAQRTNLAHTTVTRVGSVTDREPVLTTGDTAASLSQTGSPGGNRSAQSPSDTRQANQQTRAQGQRRAVTDGSRATIAGQAPAATQPAAGQAQLAVTDSSQRSAPVAIDHATVALAISPWGEIYVDGKRIGISPPMNEIDLLPGRREIRIRNGEFPEYKQLVELRPNQRIKIRYKFN